jgi:hypothetical protein
MKTWVPPVRRPVRRGTNPYLLPIMIVGAAVLIGQMFWLRKNDYLFRPFALERIECTTCSGVGVVRDAKDDEILKMCPICYGVGSHMVRRIDAEDKICPACMGMGRLIDRDSGEPRPCRRCDGRGLVREAPWMTVREAFTNAP